MSVENLSRQIAALADLKVVPKSSSALELNMPVTIDGAAILASTLAVTGAINPVGGITKGSRTKTVGSRAKVGTTAGWVVGAANNIGSMGTVAASQSGGTLVVPIEGLEIGDIVTGFTVTASINSAGGTVTLDAALHSYTFAAAATAVDAAIASGGISQISVTAATAATATVGSLAVTVATGVKLFILLTATTAGSTTIELNTIEVAYTPNPVK